MVPPFQPGWIRRTASRLSSVLFAVALLAFLLPFATVSCATPRGYGSAGGGVTATYRGVTLALGGEPELSAPENAPAVIPTAEDHVAPQPFAAGAQVLTIAGLVTSLWALGGAHRRSLWPALCAAGAALLTALALLDFDRMWTARIVERLHRVQPAALDRADPTKFVNPNVGFWTLLTLLLLATLLNAALAVAGWRLRARPAEQIPPSQPIPTASMPAQNAA